MRHTLSLKLIKPQISGKGNDCYGFCPQSFAKHIAVYCSYDNFKRWAQLSSFLDKEMKTNRGWITCSESVASKHHCWDSNPGWWLRRSCNNHIPPSLCRTSEARGNLLLWRFNNKFSSSVQEVNFSFSGTGGRKGRVVRWWREWSQDSYPVERNSSSILSRLGALQFTIN